MEIKIDTKEVATKLYNKVANTSWSTVFHSYMHSQDFRDLLNNLVNIRNTGKRITPPLKYILRPFQECGFEDVKVVFIGQDPYPQFNVADGLAFSCGITNRPEKSLQYIMKAIQDTVDPQDLDVNQTPDLTRWANQGVLLLNTAFTTNVGEIGKHYEVWTDFMSLILDYLYDREDIIYVMLGKKAQAWEQWLPENCLQLKVSHPASAAYQKQSKWNCSDVFNEVNKALVKLNKEPIKW